MARTIPAAQPTRSGAGGVAAVPDVPLLPDLHKHPYEGVKIVLKGVIEGKGKKTAYFDLQPVGGGKVFQLTDKDFIESGYQVNLVSNCLAVLTFNGVGLTATCGNSSESQDLAPQPFPAGPFDQLDQSEAGDLRAAQPPSP